MKRFRPQTIFFLVGPTSAGKTAVALKLARALDAEILSCDSIAIYRGMRILSSQPSASAQRNVAHHFIASVPPTKEYDAARYREAAIEKIKAIFAKGKHPLFVGGTGLYMSVVIDGIFPVEAHDEVLRAKLYRQAKKQGSITLYQRLKRIDPAAAKKIHPNDTRRIVRAIEVFVITGKPISRWQQERRGLNDEYQVKIICLDVPREELYARIDARVDAMFRQGLIREVQALLRKKLSKTASSGIGIRELKGYFDGAYGREEATRLIKRNTRHYAKRQLTWFRKDPRITWLHAGDEEPVQRLAKRILTVWKKRCSSR